MVIERAFLTGVPHVAEGDVTTSPAACIPLHIEDRAVGAIVVYGLLAQKPQFVTVDRELFKLLGAHAGAASSPPTSTLPGTAVSRRPRPFAPSSAEGRRLQTQSFVVTELHQLER